MFFHKQRNIETEIKLYNKIQLLSRNKLLYTKLNIRDIIQNRINLIFLHASFLFVKLRKFESNKKSNNFPQRFFDYIFKKIELDLRESGHGDEKVNTDMKYLVKSFYNILLNCDNYANKSISDKKLFLLKHLLFNDQKNTNNQGLIDYFDKYQSFCFDLTVDSMLKGDINFIYK